MGRAVSDERAAGERYAKVDRSIWVDERFVSLEPTPPSARHLFLWLLTTLEASAIPGLMRLTLATVASELEWSLEDTRAMFDELIARGMVKVDWKARLVWLPNALKRNKPQSPDNIGPWRRPWAELPNCALKREAHAAMLALFRERGEPHLSRFLACCPVPPPSEPHVPPSERPVASEPQVQPEPGPPVQPEVEPQVRPGVKPEVEPPAEAQVHPEVEPQGRHQEQDQEQKNSTLARERVREPDNDAPPPTSRSATPPPKLTAAEARVLDVLERFPCYGVAAERQHRPLLQLVRELVGACGTAGWAIDDAVEGLTDLGEKRLVLDGTSGPLDPDALVEKAVAFIKASHRRRRSAPAGAQAGAKPPSERGGQGGSGPPFRKGRPEAAPAGFRDSTDEELAGALEGAEREAFFVELARRRAAAGAA